MGLCTARACSGSAAAFSVVAEQVFSVVAEQVFSAGAEKVRDSEGQV